MQVNNLTDELVAVIGKCSLTPNKQEVTFKYIKDQILSFSQVARMAELAGEHTHLEAVSCSLLARFGKETFLAVTVFMYIFTTRCLGDLLTFRCGIVPEGDLGEKKSEGDEVERRKKVRANVEPASLLEDAVSILNEMVEQSDQDVELAEAAMNEEEGEVEIELFAL